MKGNSLLSKKRLKGVGRREKFRNGEESDMLLCVTEHFPHPTVG